MSPVEPNPVTSATGGSRSGNIIVDMLRPAISNSRVSSALFGLRRTNSRESFSFVRGCAACFAHAVRFTSFSELLEISDFQRTPHYLRRTPENQRFSTYASLAFGVPPSDASRPTRHASLTPFAQHTTSQTSLTPAPGGKSNSSLRRSSRQTSFRHVRKSGRTRIHPHRAAGRYAR